MSDLSPAETLTAAAQALRDAVNATRYEMKTGTYWQGLAPDVAWERGITNAVGGPAGDFCALMSPDAALALAEWLDSAAEDVKQIGADFRALAVARQLLGVAE